MSVGGAATVAVIVVREGRLPAGADEAVAEASGAAVVVGRGAEKAALELVAATQVWWVEAAAGPAGLAAMLGPALASTSLVVLPASPDGRDLAPRLAALMGRPLLAGAVAVGVEGSVVHASLLRVGGRVSVAVACDGPVVATLMPGSRSVMAVGAPARLLPLDVGGPVGAAGVRDPVTPDVRDPVLVELIEPDPATMDLSAARRVLGGGAGLVRRGAPDVEATAVFRLLREVAAAMGASAGATRVVTDAGWMGHERQIGTTGVAINPELYVAFGVSGASQHVGGLGQPRHTASVNTDPSCPMTAMADLGVVGDALAVLTSLARRLGVPIPAELAEAGP